MRKIILAVLFSTTLLINNVASAKLPFLAHLAGDKTLPKPLGISIDYFHVEQDLELQQLDFEFPGLQVGAPSGLEITSDVEYIDLKFDAWLLPFFNAFVLIGDLEGTTEVKLGSAQIPGLPIPLSDLNIDLNGTVLGGGITLAMGGERWFGSLTSTYTEADIDGLFNSKVESFSVQPRLGLRYEKFDVWLSAMYLEITEDHAGTIDLGVPGLPSVRFDLQLSPVEDVNYGVGSRYHITDKLEAKAEFGFGEREHQLLSLTYRF